MKISLDKIDLPERDLRASVDEDALDELAHSLREHGQKQAISVWLKPDGRYEVIFGARRTRAAMLNNWPEIEATVDDEPDERKRAGTKLIENVQRKDLTPVEESHGLVDLIGDGEIDLRNLQRQTGKSRDWLKTRLDILNFPDDVQATLQTGAISIAVARELATVSNDDVRKQYLKAAIENGCTADLARIWAAQAEFSESGIMSADTFKRSGIESKPEPQVVDQKYNCFIDGHPYSWRKVNFVAICGDCQDAIAYSRKQPASDSTHTPLDNPETIG